jgi:hypothetical protein
MNNYKREEKHIDLHEESAKMVAANEKRNADHKVAG